MSIDILEMRRFVPNDRAINIALPVWAIECEATPPLQNVLDAYEETVLKLVSIGLSADGISHTLNAPRGLVEEILDALSRENFVSRERGKAWALTERGQKYIDGVVEEQASDNAQYGFMFVSAIKKEVLPFFYLGDLNRIPWFSGRPLPGRILAEGNEGKTFGRLSVKQGELRRVYRHYHRILDAVKQYTRGDIPLDAASDLFADLEAFNEAEDNAAVEESAGAYTNGLKSNMYIRQLNCPPRKVYLTMRLIIDPRVPGGYKAESPFDLAGIDNGYFLQHIQWLAAMGSVYIDEAPMNEFLTHEIKKLCPQYDVDEKAYSVFVTERMPLLKIDSKGFSRVYHDMERIYPLMQRQNSLIDKENIVSSISRYVVEALYNSFFSSYTREELQSIHRYALQDLIAYDARGFAERMLQLTSMRDVNVSWSGEYLTLAIGRMENTHGYSVVEKFINLLVLNYYQPTEPIARFMHGAETGRMYELTERLNQIRNRASHDTGRCFEAADYDFYISHVFDLVNGLMEAQQEG